MKNTDNFDAGVSALKMAIAEVIQRFGRTGTTEAQMMIALGSATGNFLGMFLRTDDPRELEKYIEEMKAPMIKDAQSAYRFVIKQRQN